MTLTQAEMEAKYNEALGRVPDNCLLMVDCPNESNGHVKITECPYCKYFIGISIVEGMENKNPARTINLRCSYPRILACKMMTFKKEHIKDVNNDSA